MASVFVGWQGRCRDSVRQESLIWRLTQIAQLSHAFFSPPRRIVRYTEKITGRITVDTGLLSEEVGGKLPAFMRVAEAHLFGLEFNLWGNIYPDHERISFVFASVPALPGMDGALVQVENRETCRLYEEEEIRTTDFLIRRPTVHLRYYGEKWINWLLGWIKHYATPDLWYWNWQPMAGYERYANRDPSDVREGDLLWEEVVAALNMELHHRREFLGNELLESIERTGKFPKRWAPRPYVPFETTLTVAPDLREKLPDNVPDSLLLHEAQLAIMRAGRGYSLFYLSFEYAGVEVGLASRLEQGGRLAVDLGLAKRISKRVSPEGQFCQSRK